MNRIMVALVALAVLLTASAAVAKDLCVQVDNGVHAGSLFVLKKIPGKAKSGPILGYYASFDQGLLNFTKFMSIYGGSVVGSSGGLVAGMTVEGAYLTGTGNLVLDNTTRHVQLSCGSGLDEKLDVLDTCSMFYNGVSTAGHVVACKEIAPAIP